MDGIEVILGELIEIVRATAPALWAIAQRQVLANTVGNAIWAGLSILFALALVLAVRHCMRKEQADDRGDSFWYMGTFFGGLFVCVALLVALSCITNAVMYSINPSYYAIKVLLGLVR